MPAPAPAEGPNGQDIALKVIGAIVAFFIFLTFLDSMGYTGVKDFIFNTETQENSRNLTIQQRLLSSDLDLGDNIVVVKDATVYQTPGEGSIGGQFKGVKGRIVEGPSLNFEINWWRVNFPEAPNGWVHEDFISNKISRYTTLNIVPITFSSLAPVAFMMVILAIFLIIVVFLKMHDLNRNIQKKKNLFEEQKIIKRGHTEDQGEKDIGIVPETHIKPSEAIGYETEQYTKDDFDESFGGEELPIANLPVGVKPKTESPSNRRWANIQSLIHSYNQNDWKQAIIEADTILEEMLEKIGYEGNTIGERLKQANPDDFITINHAWEAHKVRNRIAHGGSKFNLSKDEAERIIELYKDVFNEFFYI